MTYRPGRRSRFSQWDGSQQPPLDADQILSAIADDLMDYGDLRWAMRNLMSKGMKMPAGGAMQGLREMLKELRERKREQLERFDLGSVLDDLAEKLAAIVQLERDCINEWLSNDSVDFSDAVLKDIARNNKQQLDELPSSLAQKMNVLEKYEFLSPDAQRKFLELLNELRKGMAGSFFNDVQNMLKNLSDGDMERMKAMLRALNAMIVKKISGQNTDTDFSRFMAEFGDMFGEPPPANLDELLEQMRKQMEATQAMMNSLSPEQRAELMELMSQQLGDADLQQELANLTSELDFLNPDGSSYQFSGDEKLDLDAAQQLMKELGELDDLTDQLREAERSGDISDVDRDLLKSLLGDDASENMNQLDKLMKALEEAGYIRPGEHGEPELTPRGSRMIGQRALGEIYARLKRQSMGNHALPEEGRFGERLEQTKPFEFGEPFDVHMPQTLRNAILRQGSSASGSVQLQPDDFEIYRSERITSTATALLVDLSWSMALRGSFQAAKRVAMALHQLITSQYPKDSFYIVGFAAYARELKPKDLPFMQWDEDLLGTNMQHALLLAEKLLAKHSGGSKQIIMISDGEPTAHLEDGEAMFAYPPTPMTLRSTLRAVKRCTQRGISINTFMLEESPFLRAFMDKIAQINGGRVFYTDPDRLGEYILVDYVENKRRKLARR
ncbi:MAG: hypothetical protein NXH85_11790 [Pseudomonadaceae bacterium]|nr:hypothetical protein [Pseudomonadaceae bacterium]